MFLTPGIILKAYKKGLFPMSESYYDPYIYWVDPNERGIINLQDFRLPKSLKKILKKKKFTIKVNSRFKSVINLCAKNQYRHSTWINNQIIDNYTELFHKGIAKSVECYDREKLVGGLYGIVLGKIFCGESMFSLRENASKIAMVYLAAFLKQGSFNIIDTQFYSEHLRQFGTKRINKNEYKSILKKNSTENLTFPEKLKHNIFEYF